MHRSSKCTKTKDAAVLSVSSHGFDCERKSVQPDRGSRHRSDRDRPSSAHRPSGAGCTQRHARSISSLTQATTKILTGATDAPIGRYPRREDDVALLARFVCRVSVVCSHLSVADSSQMHSRTPLRNYGKTMRRGYPGTSTPNSQNGTH